MLIIVEKLCCLESSNPIEKRTNVRKADWGDPVAFLCALSLGLRPSGLRPLLGRIFFLGSLLLVFLVGFDFLGGLSFPGLPCGFCFSRWLVVLSDWWS